MSTLMDTFRLLGETTAGMCGSQKEFEKVIELEKKNSERIDSIINYLWMIHQEVKKPEEVEETSKSDCIIIDMKPNVPGREKK